MWLTLALACTRGPAADAPDVVIVIVDALRADALGYPGKSRDASPNLDALAAESARFTRAYSAAPWTLPSVATLLTGQWPREHRVVTDVLSEGRFGVLPHRS